MSGDIDEQARREKQCEDGKEAAMGALECAGKEVFILIVIIIIDTIKIFQSADWALTLDPLE